MTLLRHITGWKADERKNFITPKNVITPIWCWYVQDKHVAPHDIYYSNQACIELELPTN